MRKSNISSIVRLPVKMYVSFRPVRGADSFYLQRNLRRGNFGISLLHIAENVMKCVLERYDGFMLHLHLIMGGWYRCSTKMITFPFIKIIPSLLKVPSEHVKAGESIAITGMNKFRRAKTFYFEIWKQERRSISGCDCVFNVENMKSTDMSRKKKNVLLFTRLHGFYRKAGTGRDQGSIPISLVFALTTMS